MSSINYRSNVYANVMFTLPPESRMQQKHNESLLDSKELIGF